MPLVISGRAVVTSSTTSTTAPFRRSLPRVRRRRAPSPPPPRLADTCSSRGGSEELHLHSGSSSPLMVACSAEVHCATSAATTLRNHHCPGFWRRPAAQPLSPPLSAARRFCGGGAKCHQRRRRPSTQVHHIVGGPAHALVWLLRGDSRATCFGDSAESRPTAWNGRSAIWRHKIFLAAGPVHDEDNENDVHAAKSHAECALKDNSLTSVGTATLKSYSEDITVSKRA